MKVPDSPPPRRYTSPTGRIIIPVLLVVLLIVFLGRPILVAGLDLDPEEPGPAPTRMGRDDGEKGPPGPTKLAAPYPKACLRAAASPSPGLIAAFDGSAVSSITPTGARVFALQAEPPVGFSAGGTYLATAGADLWTDTGEHVGIVFSRPVSTWAWSPVGDCIVGVDKSRLVVAEPEAKPTVLVHGIPVTTFGFSPDGDRIVFAVGGEGRTAGIWMADLRSGEVKILQSSIGWILMGWSRADRPILFRDTSVGERAVKDGLGFLPSDVTTRCGDEIVTISRDRLAMVGVSGAPEYIDADRRFRYTAVTCEPTGELLVTVRYEKGSPGQTSLAVLRRDGTFVREVAQQSSVEDGPMWGPRGTGVVFAGEVGGEGAAGPLVWFVPEGGTARATGLRVDGIGDGLDAWLDWSATPPLGHPTD